MPNGTKIKVKDHGKCPQCGKGLIVEKKPGFWACDRYPKCCWYEGWGQRRGYGGGWEQDFMSIFGNAPESYWD